MSGKPYRRALWTATVLACAAATGAASAADPKVARPLPRMDVSRVTTALYPGRAKALHLTGRVLVSFRLDASGQPNSLGVDRSEADPLLQRAALEAVQRLRFDVRDPAFHATDPLPLRITVRFCLAELTPDPCRGLGSYEGYQDLKITASMR